jgi:predicted RNA-binding Zn-ribbon protein involved in translation (DUF1610 family)
MGMMIGLSCGCGYNKEFSIGVGMMWGDLFELPLKAGGFVSLRKLLSDRAEYDLVKMLLEEKRGKCADYGQALFRCPKCRTFTERFHYLIEYPGGRYSRACDCGKCGAALEMIPYGDEDGDGPDFSAYPCPKCGKPLSGGIVGMWD